MRPPSLQIKALMVTGGGGAFRSTKLRLAPSSHRARRVGRSGLENEMQEPASGAFGANARHVTQGGLLQSGVAVDRLPHRAGKILRDP